MPWTLISLAAAAAVVAALLLQRRWHFFQYLYFLRYPALLAAVLLLLPAGACERAGAPIGNLFVLDAGQLWIAAWLAVFASWVVMYTFGLIYLNAPARMGLSFAGGGAHPFPPWLRRGAARLALFALLAAPLLATLLARSWPEAGAQGAFSAAAGVALAFALAAGHVALAAGAAQAGALERAVDRVRAGQRRLLARWLGEAAARAPRPGLVDPEGAVDFTHLSAALFAAITFAVYLAGLVLLAPGGPAPPGAVPAIAYLLLLLILLGWIAPALSFRLDRYRIPTEPVALLVPALLYGVFGTDHEFEVRAAPAARAQPALGAGDVVRARAARAGERASGRLVAVAASGGGIAAAYWTALVMVELQRATGGAFADALALVSASSGGSVGATYYVDAFDGGRPPPEPALREIPARAARTSLDAMAWGLVYPDLLRYVAPPLVPQRYDRGWALEQRFASALARDPAPTLASWREGVAAGWRPASIWNATLVESGERLLLSTFDPNAGLAADGWRARTLADLCPGGDLDATTAARLSATFPYVTPIARPRCEAGEAARYHVADGAYYDNFGVMSAVEFLRTAAPAFAPAGVGRILLVQIRASDTTRRAAPREESGFRFAALGPLETMLAAQGESQIARNDLEIALLRASLPAPLDTVVFELRAPRALSWHLPERDRAAIERDLAAPHNRAALEAVVRALRD